jgi:sugar porter (SP) family MFS transporter
MPQLTVVFCCVFAALGSFLFGYDSGIITSVIAYPDFEAHIGHGSLSDNVTGGIVSAYTGGAIVGSLAVSFVADRLGRRMAIFFGSLVAIFGGALQGGAKNIAMMVVGRLFAGFAIGMLSATIPNYCSEVAPPNIRGLLAGMQQWMLGLGFVAAQWIGYGGSKASGPFSWRFPLSLQALPALVLSAGILFLPESPRWLLEHEKATEARSTLERLHLNRNRSNLDFVAREFQEIRDAIAAEKAEVRSVSWRMMFTNSPYRKRLLLACGIQALTQTSGVNVIGYYGPRIYATLGFSVSTSLFIIGIYGAFAQLWNTVCLGIMDRVGRKKLLVPSMFGMGAALCVNATLAHYFNPDTSPNQNALRANVSMNFVFSVFFTSLGVISWVYPAEIMSMAIRSRGTSLSTVTNWSLNLLFAQCSPLALSKMGYRYFYIFAALNWAGGILIYFCYPETLGRTLEQLDELFGDQRVPHALKESTACEAKHPDPEWKPSMSSDKELVVSEV